MANITIYHNSKCGTSRNVLGFILEAGFEPTIIEYLKTPPTVLELKSLVSRMNMPLKDLVRVNNNEENEVVKSLVTLDDEALYHALVNDPILINRPIVVMNDAVKLCRPWEMVKEMIKNVKA